MHDMLECHHFIQSLKLMVNGEWFMACLVYFGKVQLVSHLHLGNERMWEMVIVHSRMYTDGFGMINPSHLLFRFMVEQKV